MLNQLDQIKISNIPSNEEWIVEQIDKETGLTHCLGKIFVPPTLHLNNQQLEWIWDFCNYGPAGYELHEIYEEGHCIYNGCKAIIGKQITYIPMKEIAHCNDDIFIRKHYDTDNFNCGYWIHNSHRHTQDKWVYTNKKEFINYWKEQAKTYEIRFLNNNKPELIGVKYNVNGFDTEANFPIGFNIKIHDTKYIVCHVNKDNENNKISYLIQKQQ